jgi:hypothetical protein
VVTAVDVERVSRGAQDAPDRPLSAAAKERPPRASSRDMNSRIHELGLEQDQ